MSLIACINLVHGYSGHIYVIKANFITIYETSRNKLKLNLTYYKSLSFVLFVPEPEI